MNIFKKIKDYDRVCKALEDERAVRNQIKLDLDVAKAEKATITREVEELRKENRDLAEKCQEFINRIFTLDAPEPEKRKYYTLVLQKQLMPFIVKKDGRIFISVVTPEG